MYELLYNTQECTCIVYCTSAMAKDEKFEDAVDWEKFRDKEVKMLDKITHLHQQITDLKHNEQERESIGRDTTCTRHGRDLSGRKLN